MCCPIAVSVLWLEALVVICASFGYWSSSRSCHTQTRTSSGPSQHCSRSPQVVLFCDTLYTISLHHLPMAHNPCTNASVSKSWLTTCNTYDRLYCSLTIMMVSLYLEWRVDTTGPLPTRFPCLIFLSNMPFTHHITGTIVL